MRMCRLKRNLHTAMRDVNIGKSKKREDVHRLSILATGTLAIKVVSKLDGKKKKAYQRG
jgi:hypothetical protein